MNLIFSKTDCVLFFIRKDIFFISFQFLTYTQDARETETKGIVVPRARGRVGHHPLGARSSLAHAPWAPNNDRGRAPQVHRQGVALPEVRPGLAAAPILHRYPRCRGRGRLCGAWGRIVWRWTRRRAAAGAVRERAPAGACCNQEAF